MPLYYRFRGWSTEKRNRGFRGCRENSSEKLDVSKLEREIRRMARTGKRNIIVVAAGSEQKEFLLYSHRKSKW